MDGTNSQTKSANGTVTTKIEGKLTDSLKARDLCNILKACKEAGVLQLSLGEIKISFQNTAHLPENQLGNSHLANPPQDTIPGPTINTPTLVTPIDLAELEEIQRDQMMMDNPEEYERTMIQESMREGEDSIENTRDRRTEHNLQ